MCSCAVETSPRRGWVCAYVVNLVRGPDNGNEIGHLSQCCLHTLYSAFYLACYAKSFACEHDFEGRQRCKNRGLFVGCHNFEAFAVLAAKYT